MEGAEVDEGVPVVRRSDDDDGDVLFRVEQLAEVAVPADVRGPAARGGAAGLLVGLALGLRQLDRGPFDVRRVDVADRRDPRELLCVPRVAAPPTAAADQGEGGRVVATSRRARRVLGEHFLRVP